MKTFLFISQEGRSWSIAQRVKEEGNHVIYYINDKNRREIGNGLIEKSHESGIAVSDTEMDLHVVEEMLHPKPDCVVLDSPRLGVLASTISERGIPVMGSCRWSDKLDIDPDYNSKVLSSIGLSKIDATTTDGAYLTFNLWCNGEDIIATSYSVIDCYLLEGDRGPLTSCTGSTVWIGENLKLYSAIIDRLNSALKKVDYRGLISLDVTVSNNIVYGLKLHACFNYNTVFTLLEMYKGKIGDLLYGIATGVLNKIEFKSKWGVGINFFIPPFPYNFELGMSKDSSIILDECGLKHIWFYDVYKKNNELVSAGCGGMLGVATAWGDRVDNFSPLRDASRRANRTISNLVIPDLMWRRDISDHVLSKVDTLKEQGWF